MFIRLTCRDWHVLMLQRCEERTIYCEGQSHSGVALIAVVHTNHTAHEIFWPRARSLGNRKRQA